MSDIGRMIVNDESPDAIRDAIMASLYAKAAERVEAAKPHVAAGIFEEDDEDDYEEEEYEDEEDEE